MVFFRNLIYALCKYIRLNYGAGGKPDVCPPARDYKRLKSKRQGNIQYQIFTKNVNYF
jgi:hypothetical protein